MAVCMAVEARMGAPAEGRRHGAGVAMPAQPAPSSRRRPAQSMFTRPSNMPVLCAGRLSAFRIRPPGLRKKAENAPEAAESHGAEPGQSPAAARLNHNGTELATRGHYP